MVKLLVEGGVDVNRKFTEMDEESKIRNATPIYLAVNENKNIEIVKFLVENGAGLNFLTSRGHGVLNKAIEENNLEMVEYLLKNGCNIMNVKDKKNQMSPFHEAVFSGKSTFKKKLLLLLLFFREQT